MTQKPFKLPRWATTTLQVLEPSEVEKDAGWPRDFKVPADWWNWINSQAYKWLRYLAGVPSANLFVRNPGATSAYFGSGSDDQRIYMINVFEGIGDLKDVGGTDRYDEWWVGGLVSGASLTRTNRYPKGLNGESRNPTSGLTNVPRHIWRDQNGDYAAITSAAAAASIGAASTFAFTSADGDAWVAAVGAADTSRPAAFADNGKDTGSGGAIMWVDVTNAVHTSIDHGVNWFNNVGTIPDLDEVYDLAYSATLDAWCAVGKATFSSDPGIVVSTDGGINWASVTGLPSIAGRHFGGVTVLTDGNFLSVGGSAQGDDVVGQGLMAISTSATVVAGVPVVPLVHRFARVRKQGDRVLAVAQLAPDPHATTSTAYCTCATFDSFEEGASGTWQRSGVLTVAPSTAIDPSQLPPEYGDTNLGIEPSAVPPLVMTADEAVFTVALQQQGANPTNIIVSELSHPTVGA